MAILEEDVKRVRDSTDIIQLVGEYTDLKRSGRNWMGRCTFHDERTPSMSVSPEGVYHCFGCQASGDAITFLREKLGLEFSDAVEMLAARLGYQLRYTSAADTQDSASRKSLKSVLAAAVEWYHEQLMGGESASKARAYLRSRGYASETIKKWKLGWAPPGTNNLARELKLEPDLLISAQLASPVAGEGKTGGARDFFSERIMFPIFNQSGEPVGFGGRLMPGAEGPKYLNSRDSRIYSKTRELYGLHKASKTVVSEDRAVVVEGYTDVIGMESAGIIETVATCGTALTDDHLRILSRFSKNIILAFDPDEAGSNAMARSHNAVKALEDLEIEIKAACLPAGSDPGDLAKENPEELAAALENPVPLLEFRLNELFKTYTLDTREDKARASLEAGRMIADYFSGFTKAATSDLVAGYITYVSERTGISYKAIEEDMAKRGTRKQRQPKAQTDLDVSSTERQILLWAVHKPEDLPEYIDTEDFFDAEEHRAVFNALLEAETISDALDSDAIPTSLLRLLVATEPPEGEIAGDVANLIYQACSRKYEEIVMDLTALSKEGTKKGIENGSGSKSQKEELTKMSRDLKRKLDDVRQNSLRLHSNEHSVTELLNWMKEKGFFKQGELN